MLYGQATNQGLKALRDSYKIADPLKTNADEGNNHLSDNPGVGLCPTVCMWFSGSCEKSSAGGAKWRREMRISYIGIREGSYESPF